MTRPRRRDPALTRHRLLTAGFAEMHRVGYRNAELDRIVERAGVTKGALYHHFEGKRALAYAVISEVLASWILDRWLKPVLESPDPIDALTTLARWGERHASPESLALGCPLAMLSQELAGVDEGFRLRLDDIYRQWQDRLAASLSKARDGGLLAPAVDPVAAATFIVAAWRGSIGLAKTERSSAILRRCRQGLESYLDGLRSPPRPSGSRHG